MSKKISVSSVPDQADAAPPEEARPELAARRLSAVAAPWKIWKIIVLLAAAAFLGWVLFHRQGSLTSVQASQDLISNVEKVAVTPSGEKPVITTVVDTKKVSQPFLANAENGDKVLLYFQAGKAIVYRPSTHQVVNIGPLTEPPARVFLRNGTPAAAIPASIRGKFTDAKRYVVVSQDAAAKRTYAKTLVVDIGGNRPDVATRIAQTIGGQVAPLPAGESRPDADILIIVGADAGQH